MAYGRSGKLLRRLKRSIKKRKARHAAAVRQAKALAKKTQRAQAEIVKQSRVRAGDLVDSGDWEWKNSGMDPETIVEPIFVQGRWQYVPSDVAANKPGGARKTGGASKPKPARFSSPKAPVRQCRGKTQDGTPCRRRGNCPISAHKWNKL